MNFDSKKVSGKYLLSRARIMMSNLCFDSMITIQSSFFANLPSFELWPSEVNVRQANKDQ
jgi:hypothetical protein